MYKLMGKRIYLTAITKDQHRRLHDTLEYDYEHPTEPLFVEMAHERVDQLYDASSAKQGRESISLGVFLTGDKSLYYVDFCRLGFVKTIIIKKVPRHDHVATGLHSQFEKHIGGNI